MCVVVKRIKIGGISGATSYGAYGWYAVLHLSWIIEGGGRSLAYITIGWEPVNQ
jgi:hypothetical protein